MPQIPDTDSNDVQEFMTLFGVLCYDYQETENRLYGEYEKACENN